VARAVIGSSLVKAAIHGADPNWGRIAGAAGNARLPLAPVLEAVGLSPDDARVRAGQAVELDPDRLRIEIEDVPVFAGAPLPFDDADLRTRMRGGEVRIQLDLGAGAGVGEAFGCDLTEAYVVENSAYST
jgi:glutamate N-acetyltransferase/amino-acid N-acetyltransferase